MPLFSLHLISFTLTGACPFVGLSLSFVSVRNTYLELLRFAAVETTLAAWYARKPPIELNFCMMSLISGVVSWVFTPDKLASSKSEVSARSLWKIVVTSRAFRRDLLGRQLAGSATFLFRFLLTIEEVDGGACVNNSNLPRAKRSWDEVSTDSRTRPPGKYYT